MEGIRAKRLRGMRKRACEKVYNVTMESIRPSTPLREVAIGEVLKIPIDRIKLDLKLYPRFEASNETVNQYCLSLDQLPPIIAAKASDPNYDFILVEGNHRLIAHTVKGGEEIDAIVREGMNRKEILIEAIRINSTHGLNLTIPEKRKNAKKLKELGLDVAEISGILSVGTSTIYEWVKDLIREDKHRRDDEILELFLQCQTQAQISESLGIDQKTVSNSLRKNSRFGEIPIPENLMRYNVWRVGGARAQTSLSMLARHPSTSLRTSYITTQTHRSLSLGLI